MKDKIIKYQKDIAHYRARYEKTGEEQYMRLIMLKSGRMQECSETYTNIKTMIDGLQRELTTAEAYLKNMMGCSDERKEAYLRMIKNRATIKALQDIINYPSPQG